MKTIWCTVRDAIIETTMFIVLSFAVVIMGKPNDCSSPQTQQRDVDRRHGDRGEEREQC